MKIKKSELETLWQGKVFPKMSTISIEIEGDIFRLNLESDGKSELLLERQLSEITDFTDGKITCEDGEEIYLNALGLSGTGVEKLKHFLLPDYIAEWTHSQYEPSAPARKSTSLFDLQSIQDDIEGYLANVNEVKFTLYKSKLTVEYSEGADLATTVKAKRVGDLMRFEVPIDSTLSFEIAHISGEITRTSSTHIKKEVRAGSVALFPVLPLLALVVPQKKKSVTREYVDDDRVYELRMSGEGWQFLLPLGTGWPEGCEIFRGKLAKAVISSGQLEKRNPIKSGSSGVSQLKDLEKLVEMLDNGLISKAEYQKLKKNVLKATDAV